jgi:hypothetical protein
LLVFILGRFGSLLVFVGRRRRKIDVLHFHIFSQNVEPLIDGDFSGSISVEDSENLGDKSYIDAHILEPIMQFFLIDQSIMVDIDPVKDLSLGERIIFDGDAEFIDDLF